MTKAATLVRAYRWAYRRCAENNAAVFFFAISCIISFAVAVKLLEYNISKPGPGDPTLSRLLDAFAAEGHDALAFYNSAPLYSTYLDGQMEELRMKLDRLTAEGNSNAAIIELHKAQENLQNRLGALESAISQDPARVLSIPLLRKDMQMLQERTDTAMNLVRLQTERVYDQNKWMIGLIVALCVSIFCLAVGAFFKTEKASSSKTGTT